MNLFQANVRSTPLAESLPGYGEIIMRCLLSSIGLALLLCRSRLAMLTRGADAWWPIAIFIT